MKTILCALLMLVGTCSALLAQQKTVDRQVVVMFKPSVVERPLGRTSYRIEELTMTEEVQKLLAATSVVQVEKPFPNFVSRDTVRTLRGGRIYRTPNYSNLYVFTLEKISYRDSLIAKIVSSVFVEYAEPNVIPTPRAEFKSFYHAPLEKIDGFTPVIPGDARFDEQWGLFNEDYTGVDINATNAWTITTGNAATIFGIIDWGVKSTNIDLSGKVSGDLTELNGDPHGTMVAGIAAAKGNNSGGQVAGVDWNAQILSRHMGDAIDIAEGIDDVVTAGAEVINLSWGASPVSVTIGNAIIAAYASGASVISANPYANRHQTFP